MPRPDERLISPLLLVGVAFVVVAGLAAGLFLTQQDTAPAPVAETLVETAVPSPTPEVVASASAEETTKEAENRPTLVRGRVLNLATRAPAPGVEVLAARSAKEEPRRTTTNADGKFEFVGLPYEDHDRWNLIAQGEGYATIHAEEYFGRVELATGTQVENVELKVVPSATLEVTTLSGLGKPAPGAKVQIYSGRNRQGLPVNSSPWGVWEDEQNLFSTYHLMESYSDSEGVCRFDGLESGTYDLIAFASGFARAVLPFAPTGTPNLELRMGPEVRVGGQVTLSRTKQPIAGASVAVTFSAPGFPQSHGTILTDASGNYEIGALPRRSKLAIQAVTGEFESSRYDIHFIGTTRNHKRNLTVFDNRKVYGKVVDAYDGQPIEGVEVWAENRLHRKEPATRTDASGAYEVITGIASHRLVFKKPGEYKDSEESYVEFKGETSSFLVPTVQLEQGVPVSGRVVDAKTKVGLVGAVVQTLPAGKSLTHELGSDSITLRTGKGGTFSFDGVPPGRYHLLAKKEGYRVGYFGATTSTSAEFSARPVLEVIPKFPLEELTIPLDILPTGWVHGRVVTVTGERIVGADVGLELTGEGGSAETRETDPKGHFEFDGVPLGSCSLVATHPDFRDTRHGPVSVLDENKRERVEITLIANEELTITGKITDSEGIGIPEFFVLAIPGRAESLYARGVLGADGFVNTNTNGIAMDLGDVSDGAEETQTDSSGLYTLEYLTPGKYVVFVVSPERRHSSAIKYDVDAGATNVDFTVFEQGSIGGAVYLSDGQSPCTEFTAQVQLVSGNRYLSDPASVESEKFFQSVDGSFLMENLNDGTYDLTVTSTKSGEARAFGLQVSKGQSPADVYLVLGGGGVLRGTVVDASDAPLAEVTVKLRQESQTTGPDGAFEFGGLSAMVYSLTFSHNDYAPIVMGDLNLQEGSDWDVGLIKMSEGVTVEGRVGFSSGVGAGSYSVELQTADGASLPGGGYRSMTDGDGYFTIPQVAPGEYRLALRQQSGQLAQARFVQIAETGDNFFEFILDGGVRFHGAVRYQNAPLANSTIALYPRFQTDADMFLAVTDPRGNFSFDGVPPGAYEAVMAEFSFGDARPINVKIPDQDRYEHAFHF